MSRETFLLKMVSAKMITSAVRHLEFTTLNNQPFQYVPGQFITFHFETGGVMYQRSYSIASIHGETSNIEIAVSPYEGGAGTQLLFNINSGDCIETSGPFGRLVLREEPLEHLVLVATGTGVTPYRSMLPELLHRVKTKQLRVDILQGVQKRADLLYGEDFVHFAKQHANLNFHAYYSRTFPENPCDYEHQGHVQLAFDKIDLNPTTTVVYLCGNPNMIDESFELLRSKGFQTNQVRREKYISPKR